ncbi:MAG: radical SAM protein [Sandaracinaceae bacterium]
MEPERQVEIQLGHMCNNRCVFCVSGQRTQMGQAGPMPADPILARIRQARELGHTKITLLGGEPTLQPEFLRILRETVALGFEEIVLFTNGAKTARPELVDAIRETGGRFTWRISIQGATCESHERTTRKPGSFGRIVRTLENLRARGERITVNMCVVRSNYEDVAAFAPLLLPYGVRQLHLDMMRPLDAGERTEEELRDTLPRYSDLAAPFRAMVRAFPDGFDVNVGNLPYCVAPDLAPWIHHDGERTDTIAIEGDDRLSRPWNKYLVKRRDKLKPASCARCVMEARCSGVFETYARFYGTEELVPIDALTLRDHDPRGRLFAVWAEGALRVALDDRWSIRALSERTIELTRGALRLHVGPELRGSHGRYAGFGVERFDAGAVDAVGLTELAHALAELGSPIAPIGPDLTPGLAPPLVGALARLRGSAPFGSLAWEELAATGSERVELRLRAPSGVRLTVWLDVAGAARSGYRVDGDADTAIRAGLEAIFGALARERRPRPAL